MRGDPRYGTAKPSNEEKSALLAAERLGERRASAGRCCPAPLAARPFDLKFGSDCIAGLRSLQHELDFHGFKGKDDAPSFRTLKNASVEQRCHVTVHRPDVAADASGRLPNGDRACTTKRPEKFPALDG